MTDELKIFYGFGGVGLREHGRRPSLVLLTACMSGVRLALLQRLAALGQSLQVWPGTGAMHACYDQVSHDAWCARSCMCWIGTFCFCPCELGPWSASGLRCRLGPDSKSHVGKMDMAG